MSWSEPRKSPASPQNELFSLEMQFNLTAAYSNMEVAGGLLKVNIEVQKAIVQGTHTLWQAEK